MSAVAGYLVAKTFIKFIKSNEKLEGYARKRTH